MSLRNYLRPPNRAWNAMGPRLPCWFTAAVARIHHHWAWQYFPTQEMDPESHLNPEIFPNGVWCLHQRLPLLGWLIARPIYVLADEYGQWERPSGRVIRMLRMAYNLNRRRQMDRMAQDVERSIVELKRDRRRESRNTLLSNLSRSLTRIGAPRVKPRISVPAMPNGRAKAKGRRQPVGVLS